MSISPFISAQNMAVNAWDPPFYASPLTTDYQANRDAIHAAADYMVSEHGGGKVFLPAGSIGISAAIVGRSNVVYEGAGIFGTELIRKVDVVAAVAGLTQTIGAGFRNMTLNGNYALTGGELNTGTHGLSMSGNGVIGTQWAIIENLLIKHTGGYGISFGDNGPYICNVVRNVWIEDTITDGIDVKNDASLNRDNRFDNVHVRRYGRSPDGGGRAGIDQRGRGFTLTGIYIQEFGKDYLGAQNNGVGIRWRPGEVDTGHGLGGNESSLSGFFVEAEDPAVLGTVGIETNADFFDNVSNGTVRNCATGVRYHTASGDPPTKTRGPHSMVNVNADVCGIGFYVVRGCNHISIGPSNARSCPIAYKLEGDDTTLIRPGAFSCGVGINLTTFQTNTKIIAPSFGKDLEANTNNWQLDTVTSSPLIWDRGDMPYQDLMPTGIAFETIPRNLVSGSLASIPTGRERVTPIWLRAGTPLTSLGFSTDATPIVSPTNQYFCLRDLAINRLAYTVNDGTTAWAANLVKRLPLTAPYVVPSTGWYLIGISMTAATTIKPAGNNTPQGVNRPAPVNSGYLVDTGITYPPPATSASIVATDGNAYGQARID